ncbi:hypothetical protein F4775DRAFT_583134 [Biscogniauxia sp. FL1348]|nr:hypothetical protein F4775DRAFT_583134 [Biscogniauxia sp. FL1348]
MTGPSTDRFQRALSKFKKSLPPDLVSQFSVCTLQDVRDICQDIQRKQGQNRELRYMRRLEPFIEAMEQFGKVIEQFTNVSEIGPIKFILGSTFEEHSPLADVLEDYYSDILRFHQAALSVFKRPKWKTMFHSTWKTFDSQFGPILQSLKSRRELLESEKGSATLYEVHQVHKRVSDIYVEQRQWIDKEVLKRHKEQVSCIREKLQAPNYQVDQELAMEDRHGDSSRLWIFEESNFRVWSDKDITDHGVLYVNGIPGAGKTTLISAVVEKLMDTKHSDGNKPCIAYFYFKHKQKDKESHNNLLRAILEQLIDQDPTMSDHLFDEMSAIEGTKLRSTKTLQKLIKTVLESYQISYIVLDGLDECAPEEAAKSINWFLSLVDGGLQDTNAILRVLFCGQRDGVLDKLLANRPSISLETSNHAEDIRRYCRYLCKRIQEKFSIPPEMEKDILGRVTEGAKGMFLYARVVLGNLLSQTNLRGLRQEIEPGTFPQGIERAYERVAARIFERSSSAERNDAMKILGWIVSARRLLRWREIQSLFCIDPDKGVVDYEERRLRVTCKDLCGSLVDVHQENGKKAGPEDIVKIVHESAREYLERRKWLDINLENARLAMFCSTYLTSEPFGCGVNEEDIVKYAVKGYYSFQDYAVQYWFDHFRECTKLSGPGLFQETMESANGFLKSYGLLPNMRTFDDPKRHDEISRALQQLPEGASERNAYLNIELRTVLIRKTIETLRYQVLDHTAQEILANLQGPTAAYKCSKSWCEYFTDGFESAEDRERHVNRHDTPFRCPFEDCFAFQLGYDTHSKLDQHKKVHHPEPSNGFEFPKIVAKKETSLWKAAERGDLATVKALLDTSGKDLNQPSKPKGSETPLYLAAKNKHFDVCKLLLERGANIDFPNGNGRSALHAAVNAGDLDVVYLLLNQPKCLPDATDKWGRSPFCEACALGHLDIVKLLFETGKINAKLRPNRKPDGCKGQFGFKMSTPLGFACSEGHLPIVQYFLQQRQPNLVDEEILEKAVRHEAIANLVRSTIAKPLGDFDPDNVLDHYKKINDDWSVIFNPNLPRRLDVDLVHTFTHESVVFCVRFSADGKYFATGCERSAKIYDVRTSEMLCELQDNYLDFDYHVRSVCFSPDGKYLAAAGDDKLVTVWDTQAGTVSDRFSGHEQDICSLDFSSDGHTIASGSADRTVRLWDIESSTETSRFTVDNYATSVAISPDAKYVAAGCPDRIVRIWDIMHGSLIQCFEGPDCHKGGIRSVAFLPKSQKLISGSLDKTIKIWELATVPETNQAQCVKTFEGHKDSVIFVASSPDKQWVISGSRDREIRFWDQETGYTQLKIQSHKKFVISVTPSPTGGYFATRSHDLRMHIWSYTYLDET